MKGKAVRRLSSAVLAASMVLVGQGVVRGAGGDPAGVSVPTACHLVGSVTWSWLGHFGFGDFFSVAAQLAGRCVTADGVEPAQFAGAGSALIADGLRIWPKSRVSPCNQLFLPPDSGGLACGDIFLDKMQPTVGGQQLPAQEWFTNAQPVSTLKVDSATFTQIGEGVTVSNDKRPPHNGSTAIRVDLVFPVPLVFDPIP